MCGIVGYSGHREALPILLDSLKRVEYRGYDSCGVALGRPGAIKVIKDTGFVEELAKRVRSQGETIGIGHTRWATVGKVTQTNAHPHTDCQGRIAIVHNGDIDNYHLLRARLEDSGHTLRSETDTEVIAHLIEAHYEGDLQRAVTKATAELEGTYAIVVMAADFPGLVVARKENPLILGLGRDENFAASDVPAIREYTDRVIYLEDDDLALVRPEEHRVWHGQRSVHRTVHQVTWSVRELDKAGYPHFMLKEIHEQPRVLRDTLAGRVSLTEPRVELELKLQGRPQRLFLLGCGTSYHAALVGERFLSGIAPFPVQARLASEFEAGALPMQGSWTVALTQSGETLDTLSAIKRVRAAGGWLVAATNVMGSSVTRMVDDSLYLRAGPEVSVAATKTFLAQLAVLYLLGLHVAPPSSARLGELVAELRTLPSKVQRVLNAEHTFQATAKSLAHANHMFLIARGINFPVALEGALKVKEIAYIHAEGFAAGELKHGPFALLSKDTPVIAIAARDAHYPLMLTAIKEIKARGAPVIALAASDDTEIETFVDHVMRVPSADPLFTPVVNAVALQLLAYYTARERGCPIDKPRHLAKSVTVH